MGKKRKNKKTKTKTYNHTTYYDDTYDNYLSYFTFKTTTKKQIHDIAEQVFGKSLYITYEQLEKLHPSDIIDNHEESNI